MLLWYANTAANVVLCLLLLFRGHFTKYRILFASLIFEVFAFSILLYTYHHFGTNSPQYAILFEDKKMVTIALAFGVIWEGFSWRNRCVRVPQEIYLFLLLAFFLLQKAQFTHISHIVYSCLRYSSISITLWWMHCFSKETPNERRRFRET